MPNAFGWPHLLIILAVILLLFGAAKLPALAKSLGQSARVFKGEIKAMKEDDAPDASAVATSVAAPVAEKVAPTTVPPADPSSGTTKTTP